MTNDNIQKPILAWFILIGGGLFALSTFPGMLLMTLIPFWKTDEFSFFSIIYMTIGLSSIVVTVWTMKRSFQSIRSYNLAKKTAGDTISQNNSSQNASFIEKKRNRFGHGLSLSQVLYF